MKYLKLFESFNESKIHEICKEYNIKNYTINKNGSIDVNQYVDLRSKNLTKIPVKFNKINGRFFDCRNNNLKSFYNSPKEVNDFWINKNKIKSFRGSPEIIRGDFSCMDNNINSFNYFPKYVEINFWCNGNPIYEIWKLFEDTTKIELLNDLDIFRDEDTDTPSIIIDGLNDFLTLIDKNTVEKVNRYKNI